MKKTTCIILGVLYCLGLGYLSAADGVPTMTKEELKPLLRRPDVVVIDVRVGKDWKSSELKIKGAVRGDPQKIETWGEKYFKDKTLVLYCA